MIGTAVSLALLAPLCVAAAHGLWWLLGQLINAITYLINYRKDGS